MLPKHWIEFVEAERIMSAEISIPEAKDLSGVGAELQILTPAESMYEEQTLCPGVIVRRDGFVPVGACLVGTGDQYFICTEDGESGPLYRIDHEEGSFEDYDRERAVAVVLKDYRELRNYKTGLTNE